MQWKFKTNTKDKNRGKKSDPSANLIIIAVLTVFSVPAHIINTTRQF